MRHTVNQVHPLATKDASKGRIMEERTEETYWGM